MLFACGLLVANLVGVLAVHVAKGMVVGAAGLHGVGQVGIIWASALRQSASPILLSCSMNHNSMRRLLDDPLMVIDVAATRYK